VEAYRFTMVPGRGLALAARVDSQGANGIVQSIGGQVLHRELMKLSGIREATAG
jgi:hypothetical protein